jgi:hypothetical protein
MSLISWIKKMKLLKHIMKNEQGIAALEFALAAPILIALLMGSIDTMHLLLSQQKVEKVAYTMADLVSQNDQVTSADMNDYFMAPNEIMRPLTFGEDGLVIISSVYRTTGEAISRVRWRSSGAGTLVRDSKVGVVGQEATLPGGLTLKEKENVIVAEVFYHFNPIVVPASVTGDPSSDIYKTAVFKPRLGALLTAPN